MDLTSLTRSIIRNDDEKIVHNLTTPWTKKAQTDVTKSEYPRPLFVRDNFTVLNGIWDFDILKTAEIPDKMRGKIRVPFSPECMLSITDDEFSKNFLPHILQVDEYLWYHRPIFLTPKDNQKILLHFGAVDQICDIYIDREKVAHHEGGYLPFTIDITKYSDRKKVDLYVRVIDVTDSSWLSRGKQTLKRGGMFYTPQSGIWQSVWLEYAWQNYIMKVESIPSDDLNKIKFKIYVNEKTDVTIRHIPKNPNEKTLFEKKITSDKFIPCDILESATDHKMPSSDTVPFDTKYAYVANITFRIRNAKLWSPESPYLYDFELKTDGDVVRSYFAMRVFSIEKDKKGFKRFCLNHKKYFLKGVLDQGYWPDGLMSAPSDKALVYDIKAIKKLGFNMMRKHVKIEEARWYYHCDKLGMIVFQDMVSGGSTYDKPLVTYLPNLFPNIAQTLDDSAKCYEFLSRSDAKGRRTFIAECRNMVSYLKNVPSIGTWVIFNEGWGQFDAATIPGIIKFIDRTRPIDAASGWFDQYSGDYLSIHNYFRTPKVPYDKAYRAVLLSECGGFTYYEDGHSTGDKTYGYKIFKSKKKLNEEYGEYIYTKILPLEAKGLVGFVYTQVSDVEDEVNGIMTYDRRVIKIRQKIY